MPRNVWDEITYPFPNFNSCTVEVREWTSNLILHLIMDVTTYPCSDESESMLIKGGPRWVTVKDAWGYFEYKGMISSVKESY